MPDVDRNVNVTAELIGGNVTFSMNGIGVGGELIDFNKDNTPNMKKREHYIVTFTLIDNTGLELRYVQWPAKSPEDGAMWVKVVTDPNDPTCPAPNSHLHQFKAISVTNSVLTVRNKDMNEEYLKFALNFIKKDGNDNNPAEYIQYDPIGDNKNGGIAKNNTPAVVAVVAAVVIIAVATKLLHLW